MILIAPYARQLRNGNVNAKNYPWPELLVELLENSGKEVVQIGVEGEKQIAKRFERNLSFQEVSSLLDKCATFVAVDSYLQHHGWQVGKRGVVIFSQSDPIIFGHPIHNNLLKDRKYLRPNQYDMWEGVPVNEESFFSPEEVLEKMKEN